MAAILVPRLPRRGLAAVLGTVGFALARQARMNARRNLAPVLGRGDMRAVRRMFVNNARYYLSLFTPPPATFDLADQQLEGWQHFGQALAMGKGCLLVSPHLGDINSYAELFVASGLPVNVLVEDLRPPRLSRLVARLRARRGVNVIVGGPGALREIYRALDRNEIVGLISDRDVAGDGVGVRFFGRETKMPAMAFAIGARRKTPVVFGAAVRLNGRVVAEVRPPFVPSMDMAGEVQRMAGVFEQFIRRWPAQWLAFQPIMAPTSTKSTRSRARPKAHSCLFQRRSRNG